MHRKIGKDHECNSGDMLSDRQTDRQTDSQTHKQIPTDRQTDVFITILRPRFRERSNKRYIGHKD